jgi:hypothetical protein
MTDLPSTYRQTNFSSITDLRLNNVSTQGFSTSSTLLLPFEPSISIPVVYTDRGKIAYDEGNNSLMYCNGTTWISLTNSGTGTVTQINTGTGLTGGPITVSGTISIANTTVTAGSYTNASITVNAQGQLTSATSGTAPVLAITGGTGINISGSPTNPVVNITNTGITAGVYAFPSSVTVNAQGQLTSITAGSQGVISLTSTDGSIQTTNLGGGTWNVTITNSGVSSGTYAFPSSVTVNNKGQVTAITAGSAPVATITAGTGIDLTGTSTDPIINIANTTVTPGSYTLASITVNAQGQLTSASSGTAVVATVSAGTGISITGTSTNPIINIANTTVSAGSYTNASITVNAQGQLTSASNGTSPVVSVTAGTGIDITGTSTAPIINIANTTVTAGSYTLASLTVNAQGQLTAASNGSVVAGTGISVTGSAANPIVNIANTTVVAGSYTYASITVNAQGQLTAASSGTAAVTSVSAGTGINITGTSTAPIINISDTAVSAGSYTYASITVNAQGQLTAASNGTSPVASVSAGTGVSVTGTATVPIINIANTTVTAGSYTYASITVNAQGQLTAASSGTTAVTSVSAGTGITISGGATTPVINISNTTVAPGSYTYASFTVNAQGQLTAASSGTAPITSLTSPLGTMSLVNAGGGVWQVDVASTGVVAGSYTYASITVNAEGLLTAASSGTTAVTSVSAGTGISITGTSTAPIVNIANTTVTAGTYYAPQLTVNAQGQLTASANILTTSGDLLTDNGTNPVRFAIAPGTDVFNQSGFHLMVNREAGSGNPFLAWSAAQTGISNVGLTYSVASSALTITLNGATGVALSATNPAYIAANTFNTPNSIPVVSTITANQTITIPSGATLGTNNSDQRWIYVYAGLGDGNVIFLGVSLYPLPLDPSTTQATISGSSNSPNIVYLAGGSGLDLQYLGKFIAPQTTAGTWTALPTSAFLTGGHDNAADQILGATGDLATFSTVQTRLAVGTNGQSLIANSNATPGINWSTPMISANNAGLSTAVASNALTVTLTQSDGASAPTTSNPVFFTFRNSTLATGGVSVVAVTSSLTITIPSGTTIGTKNASKNYIYVYAMDNAGTVVLAVSLTPFDVGVLVTSTAISGGTHDYVMYSTAAQTSLPIQYIGKFIASQTTAGTWAANATEILASMCHDYSADVSAAQTHTTTFLNAALTIAQNATVDVVSGGGGSATYSNYLSSEWNDTTGTYTVAVPGVYFASLYMLAGSAPTTGQMNDIIQKTDQFGTNTQVGVGQVVFGTQSIAARCTATAFTRCNVGDTLQFTAFQSFTSSTTFNMVLSVGLVCV